MTDDEMMKSGAFGDLKEEMKALEEELMKNQRIDPNLYVEYDVKRGLVIRQARVY